MSPLASPTLLPTCSWKPITDYVDQQFEQYFRDESGLNRKNIQDNRVHCCLYFISPFGHGCVNVLGTGSGWGVGPASMVPRWLHLSLLIFCLCPHNHALPEPIPPSLCAPTTPTMPLSTPGCSLQAAASGCGFHEGSA